MLNFPVHYKIVFIEDKTGFIASDHESKTLYISKALGLNITDDEKLCATFKNASGADDCSVIISDPSIFNYCVQKDGAYQLSGANVTFNGTDNADSLILNECVDSEINLGDGDDSVEIENVSRPIVFYKNKIRTGNGNDKVTVSGNFYKFSHNEFYLGKGSDTFSAEINPDDDVQTHSEFEHKFSKYGNCVSRNEIYAIDGYTGDGDTKGWFEKNIFEAKSYSANQISLLDGFQICTYKPEPKQMFKSLTKTNPIASSKKEVQPKPVTIYDKIQSKHASGAIGSQILDPVLVIDDPKAAVKKARQAAQDYADSFQEYVDAMQKGVNK